MTRDRLLIEASALFAQKGYNGVSIREIAGKAGIIQAYGATSRFSRLSIQ